MTIQPCRYGKETRIKVETKFQVILLHCPLITMVVENALIVAEMLNLDCHVEHL